MELDGERLKKVRLEKGISLEEVHKKTKVQLNILKALEGDSISDLSPVYLKGFLKIYCNYLGVKAQEFMKGNRESKPKEEKSLRGDEIALEEKVSYSFIKNASLKLAGLKTSLRVRQISGLILIIIASSLILYNLGKAVSSGRRQAAKPAVIKKEAVAVDAAKPLASGIRLGIRAKENCWIMLKADGNTLFQRVLEKGRFETWQAKQRIELALGNAGGVELEINGERFPNIGRRGQVIKNIVITKEGMQIGK